MKQQPSQEFCVWGDLRFQVFETPKRGSDEKAAQILCFGDITYRGDWYLNVLLLTLTIEGTPYEIWNTQDEYPSFLPYMKPVDFFRTYIIAQLKAFLEKLPEGQKKSPTSVLWMGVMTYVRELENLDVTRTLVGQARNGVERLQRQLNKNNGTPLAADDREKIRKLAVDILELLKIHPADQKAFSVHGPVL